MVLPAEDAKLVFKLYCALMQFANEQLQAAGAANTAYTSLTGAQRRAVAEAFVTRLELIDEFVAANPASLSPEELEIVSSWRHLVAGRFIALRQLKEHMILLPCDDTPTAYGVLGLSDSLQERIPVPLPAVVETVLLPFKGKIVYDGLIVTARSLTFDKATRRQFEDDFRAAVACGRYRTAIPIAPRSKARRPVSKATPSGKDELLQKLLPMINAFCQEHLNEEYAVLCGKLAEKLARVRSSPLVRGRLETWACGIIRTIGWVNFLDDRSGSPHMKLTAIDKAFGVAESTGQGKAKAIRSLLKIHQFDHKWTLPSRWESTIAIWLLRTQTGYMVDIREEPIEQQRAAFRQGLIPYVPADRAKERDRPSPRPDLLFQFKITLCDCEPAIWRRIQVFDDTMDKLHEHIQAAMGWTNSHLHEFRIAGRRCGDPELLDDVEPFAGLDSTRTLISSILPPGGAPFSFEYEYDFGDSWRHEVLLEGTPAVQSGLHYPQCLEGARACPPEDVGGVHGYEEYLQAMQNPTHERHEELLQWRGPFDPDAFSSTRATHVMQEGLPDWRKSRDESS